MCVTSEIPFTFNRGFSPHAPHFVIASVSKANGIKEEPEDITQSRRTTIESYKPPSIVIEDEEEEATPTKPTPTEAWLDRSTVLVDCFGEVVDREKVDQANLIGVGVVIRGVVSLSGRCSFLHAAILLSGMVPSLSKIPSKTSQVGI